MPTLVIIAVCALLALAVIWHKEIAAKVGRRPRAAKLPTVKAAAPRRARPTPPPAPEPAALDLRGPTPAPAPSSAFVRSRRDLPSRPALNLDNVAVPEPARAPDRTGAAFTARSRRPDGDPDA